jgi:hypothetical protein
MQFPLLGVLSLFLANTAFADAPATKQVKLVTGKEVTAEIFKAPAKGTLEGDIHAAMKGIKSGSFDTFISKQCSKLLCPDDDAALAEVKRFNLTSWQKTIGGCFYEDGLLVTKRSPDPKDDKKMTLYLWCGDKRLPATAIAHNEGGTWKLSGATF